MQISLSVVHRDVCPCAVCWLQHILLYHQSIMGRDMMISLQRIVLFVILTASFIQSYLLSPQRLFTRTRLPMQYGGHGDGYKYLPISTGAYDEYYPRILPIAGVYPTASLDEIMAPKTTPAAKAGTWAYEFTDSDGPQLGTVALPGSELLSNAIDPVVLITKNTDLNIVIKDEVEVLLVVDRGDRELEVDQFYLLQASTGELTVLWVDELPEGYSVVGKVVEVAVPFSEGMRKKPTGFLEEDDE
jgi:hypothetical protein